MTTTLKTSFGVFRGKNGDGVVQYLGIKYASLKNQLAVSEMVKDYGAEVVDATNFGPRVVAMEGCQFEQDALIQQRLDTPKAPPMSYLNGLNLNITIPDVKVTKPLPVMVFIHGGGYLMGGNWWPQYDQARFVKLSADNTMPVIAVNFNYRLGVLGNLTSDELRKAGYPGNNSLRDQKCAFQWIKAHITGFGGDPDNITAFGESAGGASVLYQLFSMEPLFNRAISMAGTPLMLKPLPLPITEMAYIMIMKELGLENNSSEERVQRLLAIGEDELVAKTPMTVPLGCFVDGDIVPAQTTFKGLELNSLPIPGHQWCSNLMIGDCQHDGNVFAFMGLDQRKPDIASAFRISLTRNLSSPTAAEAVLKAYGIEPLTSDDIAFNTLVDFGTDIAYYMPALTFAQSWPGNKHYYHFNEPNPWHGPFEGYSTHMLDSAFLFQNYNDQLSSEAQGVAIALAQGFIKYANGAAPWQEYDENGGNVKRFGPSGTSISSMVERNGWGSERRDVLFRLKKEGKVNLDELGAAWDKFLAGQ